MAETMICTICGSEFEHPGMGRRPTMCHECRRIPKSKRGDASYEPRPRPKKEPKPEPKPKQGPAPKPKRDKTPALAGHRDPVVLHDAQACCTERYEFGSCDRCAYGPYTTTCGKRQPPHRRAEGMCPWFKEA